MTSVISGARVSANPESRDSGFDAEPVIGPRFARTRWHRPGMTRLDRFACAPRNDKAAIPWPSGPFFPDRREMDDGLHRLFHVLHAHPFQPRMEGVFAGEDIGAGQSHEG